MRENTEKYITFTVPIEKVVTRIDKNGEEIKKDISYILQFINSAKFMTTSLSNFVNNLSEGIHRIKCKFGHDDKGCETYGIKYNYCNTCKFSNHDNNDLILLMRISVYPYDIYC